MRFSVGDAGMAAGFAGLFEKPTIPTTPFVTFGIPPRWKTKALLPFEE